MASVSTAVKLFVKSRTRSGGATLGDCPFCHKVMLVAALRRASFSTVLIDLENKPTWFLEMTDGKGTTPAMKVEGSSPRVLADSSDIVEWLLTHGDGPPVQRSTEALDRIGAGLFGAFVKFMKNGDPARDAELRGGLTAELEALDQSLGETASQGPFLGGHKEPTVADCGLAPKLYHVLYGAPHWKQFEVSDSLVHVHNYIKVHGVPPPAGPTPLTHNSVRLQAWEALEAWREVLYPPAAIHDGWEAKVGTA